MSFFDDILDCPFMIIRLEKPARISWGLGILQLSLPTVGLSSILTRDGNPYANIIHEVVFTS